MSVLTPPAAAQSAAAATTSATAVYSERTMPRTGVALAASLSLSLHRPVLAASAGHAMSMTHT